MIKLFKSEQVKEIDAKTMDYEPITSPDLMERASQNMTNWILSHFSNKFPFVFLIGPGNNGGDGLVIARLLAEKSYNVTVLMIRFTPNISSDCSLNLSRFQKTIGQVKDVTSIENMPILTQNHIVIDAIFGAGLSRQVEGLPADIIDLVNKSQAQVVSVDAPSGLFGEDNGQNQGAILKANWTLALQFPNISFLLPENEVYVGNIQRIDIGLHPKAIAECASDYFLLEKGDIQSRIKKRARFSHKGTYGHALLVAGAYGKMGAAILAAKACLRTGVGLLTTHIPKSAYQIMQTAVPEAMLSIDQSELIFSKLNDIQSYNAIAIGPGLGMKANTMSALLEFLETNNLPLVLDADALNILSKNTSYLQKLPENTIITPHAKEFKRLFGEYKTDFESLEMQIEAAKKYKIIIIFKGAFSRIAMPDGRVCFNSTGNPGMATGGSGDVLTGMILSLLAQNYSPEDAALVAVWMHGKAGDMFADAFGEQALIASDLVDNLKNVYKIL